MARRPLHHAASPALLAIVLGAALSGCSSAGPARASSDRGLSAGDAVGRSLFSAESRAAARGERRGTDRAVASVQLRSAD